MKRKRCPLFLLSILFVFNLVYAVGQAQEMEHGQHGDQVATVMQHESDDQMDHGHGKGMWMFEYEFMGMHMEGLLNGTDSVDSRDISGALPGPIKDPSKDYMMSPTEMRMDMHMFMLMYGLTNKISIMGMFSYLDNEMDMVMHMPTMDMFGDMDTNGLGDTVLEGLYSINDKWKAGLGLSIPTGNIDEKVTMVMQAHNGTSNTQSDMLAPYGMQLGTGTFDLIPKIEYGDTTGKWGWLCEALYIYHIGENDNEYTWGNYFELSGLAQYAINNNLKLSGRLTFWHEKAIDGQDPNINPMMAPTSDPNAYGGKSSELMAGLEAMFAHKHVFGFEIGAPIYQNLNGPQLETDLLVRFQYQFMWTK
jgi:hypothetical protein